MLRVSKQKRLQVGGCNVKNCAQLDDDIYVVSLGQAEIRFCLFHAKTLYLCFLEQFPEVLGRANDI